MIFVARSRPDLNSSWGISVSGDSGVVSHVHTASPFVGALRPGISITAVNDVDTPSTKAIIREVQASGTTLKLRVEDKHHLLDKSDCTISRAEPSTSWGLKLNRNGLVVSVVEDSPAGRSGVKEGDAIVEVNGSTISAATDVSGAMKGTMEVKLGLLTRTANEPPAAAEKTIASAAADGEGGSAAETGDKKKKRKRKKKSTVTKEGQISSENAPATTSFISADQRNLPHPRRPEIQTRHHQQQRSISRNQQQQQHDHSHQQQHQQHQPRTGGARDSNDLLPAPSAAAGFARQRVEKNHSYFDQVIKPVVATHQAPASNEEEIELTASPAVHSFEQRLHVSRHVLQRVGFESSQRWESFFHRAKVRSMAHLATSLVGNVPHQLGLANPELQVGVEYMSVFPDAKKSQVAASAAPVFYSAVTGAMAVWTALPFVSWTAKDSMVEAQRALTGIGNDNKEEDEGEQQQKQQKQKEEEAEPKSSARQDSNKQTHLVRSLGMVMTGSDAEELLDMDPVSKAVKGLKHGNACDFNHVFFDACFRGDDAPAAAAAAAAADAVTENNEPEPSSEHKIGKPLRGKRQGVAEDVAEIIRVNFDSSSEPTQNECFENTAYVFVFKPKMGRRLDSRVPAIPCASAPPPFINVPATLDKMSNSGSGGGDASSFFASTHYAMFHCDNLLGMAVPGKKKFVPMSFDHWKKATIRSVYRQKRLK